MKFLVFCEAAADFATITGLVDRVLSDNGPTWVRTGMLDTPEAVREWVFFDVHQVRKFIADNRIRVIRGHFGGEPGRAGAVLVRECAAIARHLKYAGEVSAAVIVLDLDHGDESDRRTGFEQARGETTVPLVAGIPNPEREAWVLVGFVAGTAHEESQLDELTRALTFSPIRESHKLNDQRLGSLRDIKRVLAVLTGGDPDREALCWTDTPLATLRANSGESGLEEFLDEVEQRIIPLFGR